jgi:hypothetical protein
LLDETNVTGSESIERKVNGTRCTKRFVSLTHQGLDTLGLAIRTAYLNRLTLSKLFFFLLYPPHWAATSLRRLRFHDTSTVLVSSPSSAEMIRSCFYPESAITSMTRLAVNAKHMSLPELRHLLCCRSGQRRSKSSTGHLGRLDADDI